MVQKKQRVIKRYANRKLYDMSESCYITHDEIALLVRNGEELKIIDNRTKEDLTTLTLTQILFKEEKKHRRTLPLNTLRSILQSGGDFIQRRITQPVTSLRDEAEETVRTLSNALRGRADEEQVSEGGEAPPPTPFTSEGGGEPDEVTFPSRARTTEAIREWFESTQRAYDNLQHTLEDRWSLIINSLSHLDANRRRIGELERRVAELEAKVGSPAPKIPKAASEDET